MGSVDTDDPTNGFVDVVLSVQFYFRNVPNGIESVISDQSIAAFLRLEPSFFGVRTSDVFSPWDNVDFLGALDFLSIWIPMGHVVAVKIWSLRPKSPILLSQLSLRSLECQRG